MGWRVECIFTEQTTEAKVVILHPVSVFTSECKNLVSVVDLSLILMYNVTEN